MYRQIFQNRRNACLRFCTRCRIPAIHGEKGITTFDLVQNEVTEDTDEPDYELLKFESGQRYNMVPDYAKAEVLVKENMTDVIQNFENFYNKINCRVKVQLTVVF